MINSLVQGHHNVLGYVRLTCVLDDSEHVVLEVRPMHYFVMGTRHLQPATPIDAQHVIKLDLLDVVLRARFLGVGDVDLLNMLTAILSNE